MRRLLCLTLLLAAGPAFAQIPRNPPQVLEAVGTHRFADDGNYFCAMTATPGTAYNLTGATQNAFLATQAVWVLRNTASGAVANVQVYPDIAKIVFATPGTAGTRVEIATSIDSTNRFSSGGTAQTISNVHMGSSLATVAAINAGDVTASAASGAVRYIHRATLSTAIPAAGETMGINFGGTTFNTYVNRIASHPPVVLATGHSMVVHIWLPSQSAQPTGELMMCWWER